MALGLPLSLYCTSPQLVVTVEIEIHSLLKFATAGPKGREFDAFL